MTTKNRIYLVGCEKGGVGKTSLSFNLAVLRARAGYPVLLVDADKQGSSAMWASLRTDAGHQPPLVCVQKLGKIGHDLLQLRENYEVIVDAGGADSQELRQGIAVADKWFLPVEPSCLDLFSMAKMKQLMQEVEDRVGRAPDAYVILNKISPSTSEAADAREMLSENEKMPVLETQLVNRVAMRRAVMAGCAVVELTGTNKTESVAEILSLYKEVFGEAYSDGQN